MYRVVKELQKKMSFNLWYSNYCSNKSFKLMLRYISGFDSEYITLNANKVLADNIKNLYKKNGCWTWFNDWEWFNEESFKKDEVLEGNNQKHGHIFPINFVKIDLQAEPSKFYRIFSKFANRISGKGYKP